MALASELVSADVITDGTARDTALVCEYQVVQENHAGKDPLSR
jgi:hypothetical protein